MYLLFNLIFIILGLFLSNIFIYFNFLLLSIAAWREERKFNLGFFLQIAVYSIILPDNYLPIVFWAIYFLKNLIITKGYKISKNVYYGVFALFMLLIAVSTVVSAVPFINVLITVFMFTPFFMFFWLAGAFEKAQEKIDLIGLELAVDKVLCVQLVATLIRRVCFYGGDDWSIGTFDVAGGEQAQLAVIMSLFAIFYLYKFRENKSNYFSLYKLIACLLITFSTRSFLLILMLAFGIGIALLVSLDKEKITWLNSKIFAKITAKTKKRAKAKKCVVVVLVLLVVVGSVSLAFVILPESVTGPIKLMFTDSSFLDYRFHKLTVYRETFFDIPSKDLKFAFIGNGFGNYNSRGALICTGQYVDLYNKFFEPSISEYTQEYIMDFLTLANNNGSSDYGSVLARPYASLMALMGELGYLGVIVFVLLLIILCKNRKFEAKMLIIVWLSFCFAESYFEYPKVIIVLYSFVFFMRNENNRKINS